MALDWNNVQKAWKILNEINPNANNSFIANYDKLKDPLQEDIIIGAGKKSEDGWENIFMNVSHITAEQIAIFNNRKKEVHNTSFIDNETPTITRIGWF